MSRETIQWPGRWWRSEADRVVCELCPRGCELKEGKRGFCFVRQNQGGKMILTTYGRSTGFCVDPIEKKPLNHFYPGTSVLSFGTAGCNLGCVFCQNWDISKSREVARLSDAATPDQIALAAKSLDCTSVAFTYNDPVIWAEYAIDTAHACHADGIRTVAVTAGYISEVAREPFFSVIDAANVDLKAFTEEFYRKLSRARLQPVLDNLKWLKAETDVWFEITNLVIPDANDSQDELGRLCDWILETVGDDVPVHFSAFHPDFKMRDRPRTPHETLIAAHDIARAAGIRYPYVGNVHDTSRQNTYCPSCDALLVERDWYELGRYALHGNRCAHCGYTIAGRFGDRPGTWGQKRLPVNMQDYAARLTRETAAVPVDQHAGALTQALGVLKGQNSSQDNSRKEGDQAMPLSAPQDVVLTDEQRQSVFNSAIAYLTAASLGNQPGQSELDRTAVCNELVSGAFTSLKRSGQLRSCCGCFGRTMTLKEAVQHAAYQTATSDPRFPPVSASELPYLDLEVWLLFAPEQVQEKGEARIQAITIGKHGLKIIRGNQQGLLLPGVATDHRWDAEEFLNNVCIKAGLPPTAWKDDDTILYRFGGRVIRGRIQTDDQPPAKPPLYSEAELTAYTQYCRQTLDALVRGATPQYYMTQVSDASVNVVGIMVTPPGGHQTIDLWKMNVRQPMPLQSTLFGLCERLAATLRQRRVPKGEPDVNLVIGHEPAMHGVASAPDLDGVDAKRRGVLVIESNKTAMLYDTGRSAQELLSDAIQSAHIADPSMTRVFSLEVLATCHQARVVSLPRPAPGQAVRPPAVAGTFYPADPSEINRILDDFFADAVSKESYRAAMVPHAGWRYSGRLAADVLKRVALPKTIIAIGPKHTADGVDWAVAPHHTWSLPGLNIESSYELASRLAQTIPGLELDAASHRQEHCLEVQLPLIGRLSPETHVVGIVVGGNTNLQRSGELAEGLAKVIAACDEPPLLLISTDMNHYASDQETRRLDEMALQHVVNLDPDGLYQTVRGNHISMCGVIPTVVVMKTLKALDALNECHRVGYATSADATGDTTRVVGYAGMLFR